MDGIAGWFSLGFDAILPLFQNPLFAYEVAAVGGAIAVVLVAVALARTVVATAALRARQKVVNAALTSSPGDQRRGFAEGWQKIDAAMSRKSRWTSGLPAAWEEFRETLVDLDATPIRNTQRPQEYLGHAVRPPSWLDFAANLFVGAGLLFTFLGLVAALKEASHGIGADNGDAAAMQKALRNLLAVASTKFVTSIVGVGLSITLKLVDRGLEGWLNRNLSRLCSLIERGLLHLPPQRLATEQLDELRQQTKQLKTFATELAVAIGDRLDQSMSQAMVPVVQSITSLTGSIERSQAEQLGALRDGVGHAVNGAASGELRALSNVLTDLSASLGGMHSTVSASGQAAAEQIVGAASRFESVAAEMRATFDELAKRIASMGTEATEQGKAQAAQMTAQVDALAGRLEEAGVRQSELMRASVSGLGEASHQAIAGILGATETVAARIGDAAASSMTSAAGAAGSAIAEAGQRIVGSLDGVVDRAERTGAAFSRIDAGLERHASNLGQLADRTASASEAMRNVLQAVAQAGVTTQQTTSLLRDVVVQFEKGAVGAKQSLDKTSDLLAQIEAHQKKVNETWETYRSHFEGVDKHLDTAMRGWADRHREALEALGKHVSDVDAGMGSAVTRLRDMTQPLSDLAEELVQRRSLQAAE